MAETVKKGSGLGIWGWDTYEFFVHDFERSRHFYAHQLGIPETACLDKRLAQERGEESVLFQAGSISLICTTPTQKGSRAERWLRRHPDGVSVLAIRVRNLDAARAVLLQRGATFCSDTVSQTDYAGQPYRWFEIATPLGDVRFRFTERPVKALVPGFTPNETGGETNPFRFQAIDHVTSNFLTIHPFIAWLREVLGFEEYWRIHFHTDDAGTGGGSGLASIVMWDPESKIKFANNEPAFPNYEASQIYTFVEDNRGPGVQHIAFHVPQIEASVDGLRRQGIEFLSTPATYYDMLPARLQAKQVTDFKEDIENLRRLGILVDGEQARYLLQIFMVEGGVLHKDEQAGPFFYEVIQRCGARGFGEGNFRALFEAIERDQSQRQTLRTPSS